MAPAPNGPGVTGSGLVRNTLVNGLGTASNMIVAILLTPFMLDRLGVDMFGVWALALTLTVSGYLSLTDLGLQQAAVRFMADARRDGDTAALGGLFSTTLAILFGIAMPVGATLTVLAPVLAELFSVHGALRHAAIVSFAIIGAQVVLDLPAFAFRAVLESDQRFVAIRFVEFSRSLIFAALTVTVLLLGRGVVAVAAASFAGSVAALSAYIAVVIRTEPAARFSWHRVRRATMRPLFGFSSSLFAVRILSVIYRQMDKVIIGVVLSVAAVATYEVANRIQSALYIIIGIGGSALLPAAVISRLDKPLMRDLFLRATSYSVALFLPVCVAVSVYARLLIIAWVGESQAGATDATRLFAVWIGLGTFDAAGTTMLVAIGRLKPIVILSTLWVAANLTLSIWLVHVWGITGVVAGTVISYVPLLVAYTTVCLNEFEISASMWAKRVLLPNLPGPALQLVVCVATLQQIERLPPWIGVLLGSAAGVTLSLMVYLFLGIRAPERRYLREVLSRAAGRRQSEAPG
jgi:O-antigen/teichoic acid export membrane protein